MLKRKSPIKDRVLQVINQKIEEAENLYKEEVEKIEADARLAKAEAMETAVNSVISKIL